MGKSKIVKKEVAPSFSTVKITSDDALDKMQKNDAFILSRIQELVDVLKTKYQVSARDILQSVDSQETFIPTGIFSPDLTPLESVVKYLKEECKQSYHTIGVALSRNEKNVWHTYQESIKKFVGKLVVRPSEFRIPLSIFSHNRGVLESIVWYLKEECGVSHRRIAELLVRDERTIWVTWNRVKEKINAKK